MRLIIIFVFALLNSCISVNENKEEIAVMAEIYKSIPKFFPAPPKEKTNDSIISSLKKEKANGMLHKYAINKSYFNGKCNRNISNVFYKQKSGKYLGQVSLDSISWSLAQQLVKFKCDNEDDIDTDVFDDFLNEEFNYVNQYNFDSNDEIQFNRILSFSHTVFNEEFTRAATAVTNYSDNLDVSTSIYILKKVNSKWIVTHIEAFTEIT